MKNLLTILVCVLLFINVKIASAQDDNIRDFYIKALQVCLDSTNAHYKDVSHNRWENVIVKKEFWMGENFPDKVGTIKIQYLTDEELEQKFYETNERFPYIEMSPLFLKDGLFIIFFTDYWMNTYKGDIIRELEGGSELKYKFDCESGKLIFDSIEFSSI